MLPSVVYRGISNRELKVRDELEAAKLAAGQPGGISNRELKVD
jgi:hypothetical protein